MKRIIFTCIGAFVILLVSCSKDGGLWYSHNWEKDHPNGQNTTTACTDTAGTVSFANKVAPIMQTNCSLSDINCHASHGSGGNLNGWANVSAMCSGTPGTTSLEGDINWTTNPMPKNGTKLSPCNIAVISQWIKQGALDN